MRKNAQNIILESYKRMLEKMSADQITVSALIRECGIGRSTFYYHYDDIYTLLDDVISSIFDECDTPRPNETWQDVMKAILYACRHNKSKIYHIYYSLCREHFGGFLTRRITEVISAYIDQIVKERNTDPQRAAVITDIVSYSAIGHVIHFLWHNMEDDIEETAGKLTVIYDELLDRML